MSLSKTTLSAIQQAGHGLHKATEVVASAVREQAKHMVNTVSNQPFQAEGEQAFSNFKMLARLSQDLQTLEEQLRGLYNTAAELANPEMDLAGAAPRRTTRARAAAAPDQSTADSVTTKRAAKRNVRARNTSHAAASPVTLTGNDHRILDYLKTVLKTDEWTKLTGASIAQGANMPLGSVGISLKKVVLAGAVKKTGKGSYQLATQ